MFASTTQIHPRSLWANFVLIVHVARVRAQLRRAPGLVHLDFERGWRTLTVWNSLDDMTRFRNSGAHRSAMRATTKIGRARTATWEVDHIPTWSEAIAILETTGREAGR